jgi:hypothetical protein
MTPKNAAALAMGPSCPMDSRMSAEIGSEPARRAGRSAGDVVIPASATLRKSDTNETIRGPSQSAFDGLGYTSTVRPYEPSRSTRAVVNVGGRSRMVMGESSP